MVETFDETVLASPVPLLRRADDPSLRVGIDARTLHRVRVGVYAPADQWMGLPPWQKYLARIHAVALKRPSAIFTHESAAALLGLPVLGDLRTIHVLVARKGDARRTGDIQGHHVIDELPLVRGVGVCATSGPTTAIEIARARHPAYGLAVADALLRDGRIRGDQLLALNEARDSSRGRLLAEWCLERATADAESVLESVSRAVIEWLGFPDPQLQSRFLIDGAEYRTDFCWPDHRIIGEADGDTKYTGDDGADAVIREKKREDALRRSVRGFARWGWRELRVPDRLGSILGAAGLSPIRRRCTVPLHTLGPLLAP